MAANTKLCIEENKLSEEDVKKIKNYEFTTNEAPENVKCYIKCLGEKSKVIYEDKFDQNRFLDFLQAFGKDKETATGLYEKCKELYKTPHDCQNSWELYQCYKH